MQPPILRQQDHLLVSHLGYPCDGPKRFIVQGLSEVTSFELQDMAINVANAPDKPENYGTVFRGNLEAVESPLGNYLVGDFSEIRQPGVYRIVLNDGEIASYQFAISDGSHAGLPRAFLDFIHRLRAGAFEDCERGPTHLDDSVRSDNGEHWDASGGWYDAGDTRKWMSHSTQPVFAFMDARDRLGWRWNHFASEMVADDDWVTETSWGLRFILKMIGPDGMVFEDVGGGGSSRMKPGMEWWYENHAGCGGDNSDNRFTDNRLHTGDERRVRVQYNPLSQYINICMLLRGGRGLSQAEPELSNDCLKAADRVWAFIDGRKEDEYHGWTSVRAWRLCAVLERARLGFASEADVEAAVRSLLENFDADLAWFTQKSGDSDPYRGIIHAAQPLVALARTLEYRLASEISSEIVSTLKAVLEDYALPLCNLTPFRFIPYGCYRKPSTEEDTFRTLSEGLHYRFYMPDHHPSRINHGLSGHWMSWAHALSMIGMVLHDERATAIAWDQLYWLLGRNPYNASMVTGFGYNHPMPHSRFLGTVVGGFMNGFIGNGADEPVLDMDARCQWNTTEYWNLPLTNSLMALSILLPANPPASRKLGLPGLKRLD